MNWLKFDLIYYHRLGGLWSDITLKQVPIKTYFRGKLNPDLDLTFNIAHVFKQDEDFEEYYFEVSTRLSVTGLLHIYFKTYGNLWEVKSWSMT